MSLISERRSNTDVQTKFDILSPFIHDLSFILGKAQKYVLYLGLNPKNKSGWPPSPPPYSQLFVSIFVHLNLDYDSLCCEADFALEKVNLIQLLEPPIPFYCCCSVTKWTVAV